MTDTNSTAATQMGTRASPGPSSVSTIGLGLIVRSSDRSVTCPSPAPSGSSMPNDISAKLKGWSDLMPSRWLSWIMFVAICLIAGAVGASFTHSSVKTWYPRLQKPPGTPPSWVFGPVWSVPYFLMGTAVWLVWEQRDARDVRLALSLFFIQLLLNAAWS